MHGPKSTEIIRKILIHGPNPKPYEFMGQIALTPPPLPEPTISEKSFFFLEINQLPNRVLQLSLHLEGEGVQKSWESV